MSKKKTGFFGLIYLGGKMFITNLFMYPKNFITGVLSCFDLFFTLIFNIFSFFGVGIIFIGYYIGKFVNGLGNIVWNYFLKYIVLGIKNLFKYLFGGIGYVLKYFFYDIPVKIKKKNDEKREKARVIKEAKREAKAKEKENKKSKFNSIGNYIAEKFENSSMVKYYRSQKYKDLKVLGIENVGQEKKLTEKQMFRYIAKNKEGKIITGYFGTFSKLNCYSYLLDEGYEVYKIETSKMINFLHGENNLFKIKMKGKDLVFWLTQLSTYIKSGIPLTDAVKLLSQQDKKSRYKKTYDSLIYELTMGESFASALEKQGNVFPGLLINMIRASELIGDIEGTLDDMANYYDEIESTRKDMISAMTYPSIILVFSLAIVTFILTYVVPKFVDVYDSAGVELNPLTTFILNLSDFIRDNYLYLLGGVALIIIVYRLLFNNIKAFKTVMQYFSMKLPIVGKIIIYNEITLFSKTFSALQKSNVLLTESMDILIRITDNEIYKMIMRETVANLVKGNKISDTFKGNWAIPEVAYYMIVTGERTGELAEMLEKVSKFYQRQQKSMVNSLKSFIEPIMISILAVIVGGIIISVIVPMFGLYSELI